MFMFISNCIDYRVKFKGFLSLLLSGFQTLHHTVPSLFHEIAPSRL